VAKSKTPAKAAKVPYVDDVRDYRDSVVAEALNAAIQLIEDDDADHIHLRQAAAVIRLARDRLEAPVDLTAGVARV
jgi:hypothetical protein